MKEKTLPLAKTDEWRGYTLDELRYRRVMALTRIEIEKSKMIATSTDVRDNLPFIGRSFLGNFTKSLTVVEYAVLAFKLFRRIAPLFRKKR